MHTKKLILTLVVLSVLTSARMILGESSVDAQDPAEAYIALVRGDSARAESRWADAQDAYKDALNRYKRIADLHPDWEADIVQYRIGYCENQIRVMNIKAVSTEPVGADAASAVVTAPIAVDQEEEEIAEVISDIEPPPESLSAKTDEQVNSVYKERYLASMNENQYLRQRIEEVMVEEGDAQALDELKKANDRLHTQLSQVMHQSQNVDERIRDLENQNYQLAMALADQERSDEEAGGDPFAGREREAITRERICDYEGALALYEGILSDYPQTDSAIKGRARCLIGLGRTSEAITHLREAIAADPTDSEARLLLGVSCASAGNYSEAVDLIQPLVESDPWNAYAHAVLGAALLGREDKESAQAELEKAIMLDAQLVDAQFNLAVLLAEGRPSDKEKAREYYQIALDLGATPDAALDEILIER